MRTAVDRRCVAACCAFGLLLGVPAAAHATSRDFIDDTLVSQPFKAREIGVELGAESRLDADYRTQGWYASEAEFAPTARLFCEAVVQGVTRGAGLELGGWILGSRYRLLTEAQAWIDVTAAVEYEVETGVAKHPGYERLLVPRVLLTRHLGADLDVSVNLGAASRLQPAPATGFAWAGGIRWGENRPLAAGVEITREPTENSTRITPQLWLRLPGEARLRLGSVFELHPTLYRFMARAILEAEFF
jgi:hypothetical protein